MIEAVTIIVSCLIITILIDTNHKLKSRIQGKNEIIERQKSIMDNHYEVINEQHNTIVRLKTNRDRNE